MIAVPKDDSETTNAFLTQSLVLSKDGTLNTDGKTISNIMKDRITVVNEKIDYLLITKLIANTVFKLNCTHN